MLRATILSTSLATSLAALLLLASPAVAHPGHGASGFLHPFTGLDHLLAMVGVGMWASLLAARRPAASFWVPAAFAAMMAFGAAAGFAGMNLPFSEAVIVASVFLVGGLVLAAVRVPMAAAMATVGLFALFHGYAHAVEAPATAPGGYMLGFLAATGLLLAVGLGLGWSALRLVGSLGLRALGGLLLAGGALALATN